MFWKRKASVTLTADVYARWLRALRPPWDWFLRISELEQEQLASLGDAYHQQLGELVGEALRGGPAPQQEQVDTTREEELAKQVAANLIRKLNTKPAQATGGSMAGLGSRRVQTEEGRGSRMASLFGRSPDKEDM